MLQAGTREEIVLDVFRSAGSGPLLDVGCGDGDLTARIGDACGTDALYGVDVCADLVAQSEERGISASQVDLDEEDLPFKDDQFSAIHSGEVVDYLQDPDHLFHEARRCLRPGGLFVVTTPNLASLHNRIALITGKIPFPMRQQCDRLVDEYDGLSPLSERCTLFTYSALRSVLTSHGFDVVNVFGAYSTPAESASLFRLVEGVFVSFPSLSYRNVFVCQNPR